MSVHHSVDILLSTYNGEEYLKDQLDSIRRQTFANWRLLAYDDGSSDKTCQILKEYSSKDSRIHQVKLGSRTGDPGRNFLNLLALSDAPYVMFCDQDDVWMPTKMETFLHKAQMEAQEGTPFLAFSDLRVVDANLHTIDDSYFHDMQINPYRTQTNQLLAQNVVTGCAMMINRPLAEVATKCGFADDDRVVMHDWLLGILADCLGEMSYLPEKTVLYRQHGTNEVGAHRFSVSTWAKKGNDNVKSLEQSVLQAQCITERTRDLLPTLSEEQKRRFTVASRYADISTIPSWKRPAELIRGGYLKSNLSRRIGQLLFIGRAFNHDR